MDCFYDRLKYAKDLLVRSSMLDAKPCGSPSRHIQSSSPSASHLLTDPTPYRSITGALQYLTLTRPDLAFAVNQLCQHLHQPTIADYTALKRVLRYLKGSLTSGISFQRGSLHLIGYSDADWAGDPMDRPSTSGFCIFLGDSPVSLSSKKQPTVARLSIEAKYRSLAHTTAEICWLHMLLCDLHIFLPNCPALWCDDLSAISLASNPVFHERTKHVEVDYHFMREKVLFKDLRVHYVNIVDQVADIFTKGLHPKCFQHLHSKLKVTASPIGLKGAVNKTISPSVAQDKHVEDKEGS